MIDEIYLLLDSFIQTVMTSRFLLLSSTFLFLFSCTKENSKVQDPVDRNPPTLEVPFVGTASVQVFTGFGFPLTGSGSPCQGYAITLADTQIRVLSPIAGLVWQIQETENQEFDILLKKNTASLYTIRLKHVVRPGIQEGDYVTAGAILGKVNAQGLAYLEVQSDSRYNCPSALGNAGFNYAFDQALIRSNTLNADSTYTTVCLQPYLP